MERRNNTPNGHLSQPPIRSYAKQELAQFYFPDAYTPRQATCHLMRWVRRCDGLMEALKRLNYKPTDKWFTAAQVREIFFYLGDPL